MMWASWIGYERLWLLNYGLKSPKLDFVNCYWENAIVAEWHFYFLSNRKRYVLARKYILK